MLKRLLLLSFLLSLCSFASAGDVDPGALSLCQRTCSSFVDKMGDGLHDVFLEHGVVGAIDYCAERVNQACEEFSHEPGLRVERITMLTLKEDKLLDSFVARTLAAMHDSLETGAEIAADAYEWTGSDPEHGTLVYIKPITIKPLCLSCHGPAQMVQPDVREIMQAKYNALPGGHKIGDIKGAIVVTLELPAAKRLVAEASEARNSE